MNFDLCYTQNEDLFVNHIFSYPPHIILEPFSQYIPSASFTSFLGIGFFVHVNRSVFVVAIYWHRTVSILSDCFKGWIKLVNGRDMCISSVDKTLIFTFCSCEVVKENIFKVH